MWDAEPQGHAHKLRVSVFQSGFFPFVFIQLCPEVGGKPHMTCQKNRSARIWFREAGTSLASGHQGTVEEPGGAVARFMFFSRDFPRSHSHTNGIYKKVPTQPGSKEKRKQYQRVN